MLKYTLQARPGGGGSPVQAPGSVPEPWAACPSFHRRSLFTGEARRDRNQIMTRHLNDRLQLGKAGRQGAWSGEISCFPGHCLLILQLPLSPSPFLPFCLPHPGLPPPLLNSGFHHFCPGCWGRAPGGLASPPAQPPFASGETDLKHTSSCITLLLKAS